MEEHQQLLLELLEQWYAASMRGLLPQQSLARPIQERYERYKARIEAMCPPRLKYLVIGGEVLSKNDGQRHYISARRLIELYDVDPRECILTEDYRFPADLQGINPAQYIILRPRYDGDYTLPQGPKT